MPAKIQPKISILTPTFNCGRLIARCIDSVLQQDYPSIEHIIVDGASSDDTLSVLKRYPHIRWISEPDNGEGEALNKALALATGDLVVWLNADDWLAPHAFRAIENAYSAGGAGSILYGSTQFVDEHGAPLWFKQSAPVTNMQVLLRWWLTETHPHQPSIYFPLSIMRAVGRFNDSLHFSIDYEYWLRCAQVAPFRHVDAVLSFASLRPDCKSANTETGQIDSHWQVLLPFLKRQPQSEQTFYWAEYFLHRLKTPNHNESTREPKEQESIRGLHNILSQTEMHNELLALLFPDAATRHRVSLRMAADGLALQGDAPKIGPRIAGVDGPTGKDLTQIDQQSDFSRAIHALFKERGPRKIIETGTYLGMGTTSIIAEALRDNAIDNATFFSIEVNPNNYLQAQQNLAQKGLLSRVTLLRGLSLPRDLLPTQQEIFKSLVTNLPNEDVFVDHKEDSRADLYHGETNYNDCPENLLDSCLKQFDYRPDFVLLDSAGHIGTLEFQYVLERLKGPCIIALDDIKHVKHFASYKLIQNDSRFRIINASDEKFGFCVAEFQPPHETPVEVREQASNKLLWVKTDSIGDSVLAASMIPSINTWAGARGATVVCQEHIAEVYQGAPGVDQIVTFSRSRFETDEMYRTDLMTRLRASGFSTAVNPTFSRDLVSDYITLQVGAVKTVAWDSPPQNLSTEQLSQHNPLYTVLVSSRNVPMLEIEKNQEFLRVIGAPPAALTAQFPLSDDDCAWARSLLASLSFDPQKTVPVFFGAQYQLRYYRRYGEALRRLSTQYGYKYLGLGSSVCRDINTENLIQSQAPFVDLSGQTSLRQAAAIMKICERATGAETGLAHIACALGVRNVILLGGGHFGRFMPYSPLTVMAALPLECFGCNWGCKHTAVHCVRDLDPDTYYQALDIGFHGPVRNTSLVVTQDKKRWPSEVTGLPGWNDSPIKGLAPQCQFITTGEIY